MNIKVTTDDVAGLAPSGYHVALRIGFSYASATENTFPAAWVAHYTRHALFLDDPVIRWAHTHTGGISWDALAGEDDRGVLALAATFGLTHGYAVSVCDDSAAGHRSYGMFARSDRPFDPAEQQLLTLYTRRRHRDLTPPEKMTDRETDVLMRVSQGMRLKIIAYDLGLSESAIKQRLRTAKEKLGAKTSTEATAMARERGLI